MRIARGLGWAGGMLGGWLLLSCGDSGGSKGSSGGESPPVSTSGASRPTTTESSAPSPDAPMDLDAVRIDPVTFLETPLGRVRFESKPPFKGTVLEGDAALRAIIEEANGLEHVMSSGLLNQPGTKVVRAEDQFFRIMRFGWLKSTHGVSLRDPAIPSSTPARWNIVARKDKTYQSLGTIELDGNGYLRVLGGPEAERNALGKLAVEVNERYSFSRDIPPPDGKRGKWGRGIARGTAEHRAAVRDRLLTDGFVLLPEGLSVPEGFAEERRINSASTRPWLSIDVSGGFFVQPESPEVPLELSGPPGGPSALRVVRYRALANEASALGAHVASVHGKEAGFVEGKTGTVEIAARKLLARTFQTGKVPAARSHLVVMWPRREGPELDASWADDGVLLEISVTDGPKDAQALADHPSVRAVVQSLYIDLEPYD